MWNFDQWSSTFHDVEQISVISYPKSAVPNLPRSGNAGVHGYLPRWQLRRKQLLWCDLRHRRQLCSCKGGGIVLAGEIARSRIFEACVRKIYFDLKYSGWTMNDAQSGLQVRTTIEHIYIHVYTKIVWMRWYNNIISESSFSAVHMPILHVNV